MGGGGFGDWLITAGGPGGGEHPRTLLAQAHDSLHKIRTPVGDFERKFFAVEHRLSRGAGKFPQAAGGNVAHAVAEGASVLVPQAALTNPIDRTAAAVRQRVVIAMM